VSLQVDAGLSPSYAALLRALCPSNTTQTTPITTAMDPGTPNVLDNNYYKLLPRGMCLFFSDNQLRVNTQMAALVSSFAANETLWKEKFAAAMVKMGRIQVQTGTCGEVRLNCGVVNPSSYSSPASTVEMGSSAPAVDEEGYAAS
jgi:peroxidase